MTIYLNIAPVLVFEYTTMSKRVTHVGERIAAAGCYLPPGLPVVGLLLLFIHSKKFVRFHALQSLLLVLLAYIGFALFSFLGALGWVFLPFWVLVVFVLWLIGMVECGKGRRFLLPFIGKLANRFVGE